MDISAQTVLIVGGTSGIGLELARRFAAAGSVVIIGGRREDILRGLADEGFGTIVLDVTDGKSVERARESILARYSTLSVLIAMSGVVRSEDLRETDHAADAELMITTNLLGTIRLVDAFLPRFLALGRGTIITVSSASAFVPNPTMPTYAATKAGVHVYSQVLRAQLLGTRIDVVELVPPAVTTTPQRERANPGALRLDPFIDEVIALLSAEPTPNEILVERVLPVRWAERNGTYDELFADRVRREL